MKIDFSPEQVKLLENLDLSFDIDDDLSDDDIDELDDKVSDYFSSNCISSDEVTEEGIVCESIMDLIGEL